MADVVTLRINDKYNMSVSRPDVSKITGKLKMCFNYAQAGLPDNRASVHSIIMGPRPDDVPKDWVIDHADRDKLNNTRENLRWVSRSFNIFNQVRGGRDKPVASRFRGVKHPQKNGPRWCACGGAGNAHIGYFTTEREAAIAAAKAYIRTYGEWAESSDLLFTADQSAPGALLSLEELADIKRTIAAEDALPPALVSITKGSGVRRLKSGKFEARFCQISLGNFSTLEAAVAARKKHIATVQEDKWQAHKRLPITYDEDGDAAITLGGKYATGAMSKVDMNFWHVLTFEQKWRIDRNGYARSQVLLHKAVMLLIDSDYVSSRDASVDHKDPTAKLDNRRSNLRVATHAEQMRNQAPRTGGTSIHVGISAVGNKWKGDFHYKTSEGRQRFCTPYLSTEREVGLLLNAKRREVHGDKAILDPAFL